MWKRLTTAIAAAALLLTAGPVMADLTRQEAAELLAPSVFSLGTTRGGPSCTATKIGPREYLTAGHCARSLATNFRMESVDGQYAFVRSVLVSLEKKDNKADGREDWAILRATSDNKAPSLTLGCGNEHYVGEPVAYIGFPESLTRAFGTGYISTMEEGTRNNADIFVDLPGAPGASGSAVISMVNGQIMGILTEGVFNTRTTEFYMVGLESVENLDVCEDWASRMKDWDELGDDDSFMSEDAPKFPKHRPDGSVIDHT